MRAAKGGLRNEANLCSVVHAARCGRVWSRRRRFFGTKPILGSIRCGTDCQSVPQDAILPYMFRLMGFDWGWDRFDLHFALLVPANGERFRWGEAESLAVAGCLCRSRSARQDRSALASPPKGSDAWQSPSRLPKKPLAGRVVGPPGLLGSRCSLSDFTVSCAGGRNWWRIFYVIEREE